MKIRKAAVAGRFYPDNVSELDQQLHDVRKRELPLINGSLSKHTILGGVIPHAGYMFSAYQAIHFFEILRLSEQQFDTFVIVNPNHTGYGPEIALEENDFWETPYGKVEIDKVFHGFLNFAESGEAHKFEHSGEVIVPLLQYSLDYDFRIVPITMFRQDPQNAKLLAESLFDASQHLHKRICLIASSDFSHFVSPEEGKRLDGFVLKQIQEFNSFGVFKEVREKNISVCGYGPIMTLMEYAMLAGQEPKTNILKSGHSGEVHPSNEVVDYTSILFYQD